MEPLSLKVFHTEKKIPIPFTKTNFIRKPFLGYGILWNVYKFYGIDFCETSIKDGKVQRFLKKIIPFFLHLTQGYLLYANFKLYSYAPDDFICTFPFSISGLMTILLWHTLYRKRIHLKRLLRKFSKIKILLEGKITGEKTRDSVFINLWIVVATLFSSIVTAYFALTFSNPGAPLDLYYSLFIRFPNITTTAFVVRHATTQLVCTLQYNFPALTCTLCSAIYYKYSNLVRDFSLLLKSIEFPFLNSSDRMSHIVKVHKMIYDVGYEVENLLSAVVFFLLCNQVIIMYVTLATFMSSSGVFDNYSAWECAPAMTVVPLCVVIQVLCAVRVPIKFSEVSLVLKTAQDKVLAAGNFRSESLKLIKLLKDEPYPKMTAWRVVELRPSFIFTLFGALFTYGLLVVNVKNEAFLSRASGVS